MKRNIKHDIGSLMPTINSLYASLTKSEQKVADCVLSNATDIIYNSIDDLAEMAGVGDTTVLRFCRKIGYKGFQSFKMALVQDITVRPDYMSELNEEIKSGDEVSDVARKTLNYMVHALNETLTLLKDKDLKKAVDFFVNARKIEFFGVGTSSVTALDAMCRFTRIGLDVGCSLDTHMQAMKATLLTQEDVAVGISFSGSTKDTVEALSLAKKAGAKTICITHHAKSPITKVSDIVLLNGAKENPLQGGAISSKISQLLVIDIIYNSVFLKMYKEALGNKERTSKAVLDKLY